MPRRRAAAFSLMEMLIVAAIMAVLAGLLLPVAHIARRAAHASTCTHYLKQLGHALSLYMDDWNGSIPRRGQGVQTLGVIHRMEDWFNALPPYLSMVPYRDRYASEGKLHEGERSVLVCPMALDPGAMHFLPYAMNMYLSPWIRPQPHRVDELPYPSQLVFIADGPGAYSATLPSRQDYGVAARHSGNANVVFVDGHVATFAGTYLGCGVGDPHHPDVRWETETDGINQPPLE